ncbi:MAG: hypothetical protein ABUS49_02880 [Acidobacteriota bacterium]
MAPTRRPPRILARRQNPVRDLVSEKQRAAELARSRKKAEQLQADLPALIENQVGEQMQRLESKLVSDFRQIGQRAVEESAAVLNDQLNDRIQTLEEVSALQSKTLLNLRDSSRIAERKVSSAVDSIEKNLANAVPGFRLEPAAFPARQPDGYNHPQFRLEPRTEVIKADPQELEEVGGRYGFCPSCTSTNIRRANRQGLFEEFLRLFFIAPFRCRACRHKFFKF